MVEDGETRNNPLDSTSSPGRESKLSKLGTRRTAWKGSGLLCVCLSVRASLPGPCFLSLPPPVPSTLLSGSGAQREMQTAMAFSSPGKATAKKQEGAGAQVGRGTRKCGQGSRLLRAGQGYGKGRGGPSSWESPPDNSSSWGLPPPLDNSAICCPCHTLCFESVQHT